MPIVDPSDLAERNFLMCDDVSRHRFKERIVKAIEDYEVECAKDSSHFKFACFRKDNSVEEVLRCNSILEYLQ